MRSLYTLGAVAVLASGALTGCAAAGNSGAAGAGEKQVNIAFLGYSAANGYTKNSYEAAKKAAEKLGAKVTFFDGKFDGATQLAQARDAIASGKYQALEILPNNSQQLVPVVKDALAKGIKVAAIDYVIGADATNVNAAGVDGITVQIADNMAEGGQVQGEKAAELCAGIDPCKAMIVIGSKSSEFDVVKLAKIKEVLAKNPNIKVVSESALGFDEAKAEQTTRDVLQANPDLNLIITTGDQNCFGAERAATSAGKEFSATTAAGGGKIACLGWGASREGVQAILAGKWPSSIALVPETFGAKAAEALVKAVQDPSLPALITTQTELSPVGRIVTQKVLQEHPDFKGEWDK
jgi:ribose transport system substrate-binding protein